MSKRTKVNVILGLLGILMVAAFGGCKPLGEQDKSSTALPITLGYCPTMTPYVQSLVDAGLPINALPFENSMRAVEALNAGTVQAALIGRTAREHESGEGIGLVRIKDGYTLIAQAPGGIPYEALPLIRIMTLEENQDAAAILPPGTSLAYYQNFDRMLADLDGVSAVMLRWSELPPSYQLLIPFDEAGNKVPEFRSPHLYFDEASELDFTQLIDTLSSQE